MKFKLEIDIENEAFEPIPAAEVSRILNDLGYRLGCGLCDSCGPLIDINGNKVGSYGIEI